MADALPVRPTHRCLRDLGLAFPPLDQPLDELAHAVVQKAQSIPALVGAGGARRVLVASDRVWFKCKTSNQRAIVTELDRGTEQLPEVIAGGNWWWIGAAGLRQEGSPDDFYAALKAELAHEGRGTGSADSRHLLPQPVDIRRLSAEAAAIFASNIRRVVRGLIADSLRDGRQSTATFTRHRIGALVATHDGDAYLAISADGFIDPKMVAVMLDAVPGVANTDWMAEPTDVLGITPLQGQIVYSTMIPPTVQDAILDEHPREG